MDRRDARRDDDDADGFEAMDAVMRPGRSMGDADADADAAWRTANGRGTRDILARVAIYILHVSCASYFACWQHPRAGPCPSSHNPIGFGTMYPIHR